MFQVLGRIASNLKTPCTRMLHSLKPDEAKHLRELKRVEGMLRASGVLSSEKHLTDFLETNRLMDRGETILGVFERSTRFLAHAGEKFYGSGAVDDYQKRFFSHVSRFEVILGSPMLTNAGRRDKSISACSIPPMQLSKMSRDEISKMVSSYHTNGMGTGFSLDDLEDPVAMVKYLNEIAIGEVQTGKIERSCGNMGVLSIDHPEVLSYIRIRIDNPEIKEWKFNLSVNLTDTFMAAFKTKTPFMLRDGSIINPQMLMVQIAENIHATGDPGIIFMDRINQLNRLPHIGSYKTVVPCGEVSLYDGEVCQFSYLNLLAFMRGPNLDKDALRLAVHTMVVMLDNAVEANISRMPNQQSSDIVSSVRRIGVGICGLAETLQAAGLPYDSEEGRRFASDLMSFINYESKVASIDLAKQRGPFPAFDHPKTRCDLFLEPFATHPTSLVSDLDWNRLRQEFNTHKIRNLATTILPPTGRSSLIAGVTGSIEPPFRLVADEALKTALKRHCTTYGDERDLSLIYEEVQRNGSLANTTLPDSIKRLFETASEISAKAHVGMTASVQKHVDEGISKTVNLPQAASVNDIVEILELAYNSGLKGVTAYRDGCRDLQPKALSQKQGSSMSIIDPLYGPTEISSRMQKLISSPLFTRLKSVHQNGTNFLVDPRQSTTRFEHSIGVMALVKMLGGSESEQIGALLHDISHTTFSHVVDLVFQNKDQSHHELIKKSFLNSDEAKQMIKECNLSQSDLDGSPLVKGPGLTTDRLDYLIRDLKAINRIYQPEYSSILNNLVIGPNRELVCKNLETARLIFQKFLQVNLEVYFNPINEAASLALATILKAMLSEGHLTESDLLKTEGFVIERIMNSPYKMAYEAIKPNMEFSLSESETTNLPATRKLRYIDPKIEGMEGRLTDHCPESRERLNQYLKTPTTVYYNIPTLNNL